MAKRKSGKRTQTAPAKHKPPVELAQDSSPAPEISPSDQISFGALSLHDLFEQQTRQMLDRTDLDEEQKQHILVAMSCPCCGAGAMSYTVKLRR